MKPKSAIRHFLAALGAATLTISSASAADVTWDIAPGTVGPGDSAITGGDGTWDTTNGNWTTDAGANNIAWGNDNHDTAVFSGTAGTVGLGTGITIGGLKFNTDGYLITGDTLTMGAAGSLFTGANVTATISSVLAGSAAIAKTGAGTLTLSGTNTHTGATTLNAGTLKLDFGASDTSKLADGAALFLNGGTLELSGGSHLETVSGTTLSGGTTFVTQTNSGTAKLAMGAITISGGALDFSASDIATTTRTNTNGVLAATAGIYRFTVAGADWAKNDGSNNIVAYDTYTTLPSSVTTIAGNTNFFVNGDLSINTTANLFVTSSSFKITPSAANQSITVADNMAFSIGSVLFTGDKDFSINTSGANGRVNINRIHHYATGTLTLGALGGTYSQYGTGKTILTQTAAAANNQLFIYGGTVQISSNAQIGTGTGGITLGNGTLELNSAGTITLSGRAVTLTAQGGTLDVTGGGTMEVNGVISGSGSPLNIGSGSTNGTVSFTNANTYTNDTNIVGGTLALGAGGSIASSPTITVGSGATLDASAVSGGWTLGASQMLTGSGGVTGNVTVAEAANLAPGDLVGTLSIGGNLTVSDMAGGAGRLFYELGPIDASDRIAVTGTLTIGSGVLGLSDFDFTNVGGLQEGVYTLITSGTLSGTLDATDLEGTIGATDIILGTSGNNIILTVATPGSDPFDTWAATGTLGLVTFDGDTNGDGVQDGLAFLLGAANPDDNALGLLPTVTADDGTLVMTFNCLSTADRGTAELRVEHSSDLGIGDPWLATVDQVPDADDLTADNGVTFTVVAGPAGPPATNTVTATIGSGQAADGKLFGRLVALKP